MQHLIIFIDIITVIVGLAAVLLFTLIYLKYKVDMLRNFIIVQSTCVFGLIISLFRLYYMTEMQFNMQIQVISYIFFLIFLSLNIYYISRFFHDLTESQFTRLHSIIFAILSFIFIINAILPFCIYSDLKDIYSAMIYGLINFGNFIYISVIIYICILMIVRYKKVKNPQLKKLLRIIMILILIYLVGMSIDLVNVKINNNYSYDYNGLIFARICLLLESIIFIVFFFVYFVKKMHFSTIIAKIPESFIKQFNITEREEEILMLLLENKTRRDISRWLFISPKTVEKHISNIYHKLSVKDRDELYNLIGFYDNGISHND
jgi:DNA-binding CsgD family transcriptional regulator